MNLWREYSSSYIKNNKATSVSIIIAAFVSSVLLSLTCGVFYNIWADNIRLIKLEVGDWQGKLTGNISEEDVKKLEYHPNIKKVVVEEDDTANEKTTLLYFNHIRRIYDELPELANEIGLPLNIGKNEDTIQYNHKLLTQYFIFSPEEKSNPPLILFVYLFTMLISCFSLIMIIHNAFGVSMNARLHQLGVLQSIGATPGQIRSALINEAMILCLLPILSGIGAGTGLCYVFMQFMKNITNSVREHELVFQYNPYILLAALVVSLLTVWISASIPAIKMSRISPLEAIYYGKEQPVKRIKRFLLLSRLFGIEGELARKSIYSRRKAFRTSSVSLTLSFLVFSAFLNLEAISSISTQHTFFERFKDKWDLMVTTNEVNENQKPLLKEIRNIEGISKCIAYRKAKAYTYVTKEMLSAEVLSLGGIEALKDTGIRTENNHYIIEVPVIIMDDESFREYCIKIGTDNSQFAPSNKPKVITVNTIWDNRNSNRRYKKLVPFINMTELKSLKVFPDYESTKSTPDFEVIPAVSTDKLPEIREEFDNFTLIQIMSESSYENISQHLSVDKINYNILVSAKDKINDVQDNVKSLLAGKYEYSLENRLEKEQNNISFRNAYKIVIGGLTGLLVLIGLANVFSNTLGQIYQRKREFARYITIGLTPKGVKKILLMETVIIGLKPILISLLINIPIVFFALKKSLITMNEFIGHMPVVPITLFALVIILSVMLSSYLGGRKICKNNLIDALKDDTML